MNFMSAELITLDTNILVYVVDRAALDKHRKACRIIDVALGLDCVLTLQALCEFYFAVTRKGGLSPAVAHEQVQAWQSLFPVIAAKPATLVRALQAVESRAIAFWDAMLWATAREAGVTVLLSEDFQDGQVIDGVRIVNPFTVKDIGRLLGKN